MSFHSTSKKTLNELLKINNEYDKVPTKYLLSLYRRVQVSLSNIRKVLGNSIDDNLGDNIDFMKLQVISLKKELDKREHIK
jgi:hypothetical protein